MALTLFRRATTARDLIPTMKFYLRLALLFSLIIISKLTKEAETQRIAVKHAPEINPISMQLASFFRSADGSVEAPQTSRHL